MTWVGPATCDPCVTCIAKTTGYRSHRSQVACRRSVFCLSFARKALCVYVGVVCSGIIAEVPQYTS